MAEEKKKPAGAPPKKEDANTGIMFFLAGLFLVALILGQISAYINSMGWASATDLWYYILDTYLRSVWNNIKIISVLLSGAALIWTIYSYFRLQEVIKEEEQIYGPIPEEVEQAEAEEEKKQNKKWVRVVEHARSEKPADWRLAIMEADIILEEALKKRGFPGETIGEMLKGAKPGDFLTLEAAWEAHKVRNNIAHAGGDFELNEREKDRVISLFEAVFKELGEI